jgi:RNA polymerase sigma-70 factor (ECF subfamily)
MMAAAEGLAKSPSAPSDSALVAAARGGEAWAMEALFRKYASMVNGLVFRLIGRDSDVEDLVQESFAQAFASLNRLQAAETFCAWLSSITVRTTQKMLRHRRLLSRLGLRQRDTVEFDKIISKEVPPDAAAQLIAIYRVVENLPPRVRVPLVLHRVQGSTLEEVAALTGMSLATVKRRLNDAERELGRVFGARSEGSA